MNEYGEIYLYRARKPWLALIFRRHTAYVGKTRSPGMRDREHMTGAGRWGNREPAPWSDLEPRRYVIFKFASISDFWLSVLEFLTIRITMPVYNVHMNTANPRRIPKWKAREQRTARDRGVNPYWTPRPAHLIVVAALVTAGAVMFR